MRIKKIFNLLFLVAIITSVLSVNCFADEKLQYEKNIGIKEINKNKIEVLLKIEKFSNKEMPSFIEYKGNKYSLQEQKFIVEENNTKIKAYYKLVPKQNSEKINEIIIAFIIIFVLCLVAIIYLSIKNDYDYFSIIFK